MSKEMQLLLTLKSQFNLSTEEAIAVYCICKYGFYLSPEVIESMEDDPTYLDKILEEMKVK